MIRDSNAQAMTQPIPRPPARARWAQFLFTLVLLATLAGCYTYVFLPGEVRHEKVSPAYILQIVNRTGTAFSVEPSAYGLEKGFPVEAVADGARFEILLQVRSFRIGGRDRVGGHQVLDGPYIAQDGANTAVIRVRHSELYLLTIDLESDTWFAPRNVPPTTAPLELELGNFEPQRRFRSGPP